MGAFTDMLLPDRGSGEGEKTEPNDEGEPLPGTVRHREFYPEGVAEILRVSVCFFTHLWDWVMKASMAHRISPTEVYFPALPVSFDGFVYHRENGFYLEEMVAKAFNLLSYTCILWTV
jgi:hypothetical protein